MKNYVLFAFLTLVLVSCAPDPREAAAAYAERSDANARSAEAEQARAQDAEEHEMAMQNKRAAQAEWQLFINDVIGFSSYFVRFTLMLWFISLGAGGVVMLKAFAKYANRRAEVLAEMIDINPKTHMYPVFMVDTGKNVKALMNPNDNSVTLFDMNNPADHAKVMAIANVLHAGQLARHARMSHKPGEVAAIAPVQIIESE